MIFRSAVAGAFLLAVPVKIPLSLTAELLPFDRNISHSIRVNPDFSATIFYNDGTRVIKIDISSDDYIDLRRRRQAEGGDVSAFYERHLRKRVEAAIAEAEKVKVPARKPGQKISSVDLTYLDESRALLNKFDSLKDSGNINSTDLADARSKYEEAQTAFKANEFEKARDFAKEALRLKTAAIEKGNRDAREREAQDRKQASDKVALARTAAYNAKQAALDTITPYYNKGNSRYKNELQGAFNDYAAGLKILKASKPNYEAAKAKFESALAKAQQTIREIEQAKKVKPGEKGDAKGERALVDRTRDRQPQGSQNKEGGEYNLYVPDSAEKQTDKPAIPIIFKNPDTKLVTTFNFVLGKDYANSTDTETIITYLYLNFIKQLSQIGIDHKLVDAGLEREIKRQLRNGILMVKSRFRDLSSGLELKDVAIVFGDPAHGVIPIPLVYTINKKKITINISIVNYDFADTYGIGEARGISDMSEKQKEQAIEKISADLISQAHNKLKTEKDLDWKEVEKDIKTKVRERVNRLTQKGPVYKL